MTVNCDGALSEYTPERLRTPAEDIAKMSQVIESLIKIILFPIRQRPAAFLRRVKEAQVQKLGCEDTEESRRDVHQYKDMQQEYHVDVAFTYFSVPTRLFNHVLTVMNSCVRSSLRASSMRNKGRVSIRA